MMEFKVLSGQHITAFEWEDKVSSTRYHTKFGALYTGEQFKITTSGERAIIYKKREKFPKTNGKFTYSYFLLGDGEILSHEYVDLTSEYLGFQDGWGKEIVPTSKQVTDMSLKTIFDMEIINNPINWKNTYFAEQQFSPKNTSSSSYTNIFCANMTVGSKLSNKLVENELDNMFFGYPTSMEESYCNTPMETAISKFYGGFYDDKMPLVGHTWFEHLLKTTLLWDSKGKLTNYGRLFANKNLLNAFEVYNMLDSNSFTSLAYYPTGLSHNDNNPFSFDINNGTFIDVGIAYNSERYASSRRIGSSTKADLKDGLADDYLFVGIYVTEDYDAAKKYVDDGTVPDDAKKVDDIGTTPIDDEDETKNDDGKDNSHRDNQENNDPTNTALNSGATNYYYMNKSGLENFIKWFWNNTGDFEDLLNNWFTNVYGDMKECITGVYHFPCPLSALASTTGQKNIYIGRYDTGLSSGCLVNPPKNILLGSVNLNDDKWKNTDSFLDFEGYTTISLYLPYYGLVDLPTKTVMYTTISVYYAVDVPSMQLLYTVKSNDMIVFETSISFGDIVPISLSSGIQNATNTMNMATNIATSAGAIGLGVATGGAAAPLIAGGVLSTVASAHTQTDGITVKGNATGQMGKWGSLKCALIVTKPISKRPKNYGKIKGNLICDDYKLSSLKGKGLTICENPRLKFSLTKPTLSEISEIYDYLKKGVIL